MAAPSETVFDLTDVRAKGIRMNRWLPEVSAACAVGFVLIAVLFTADAIGKVQSGGDAVRDLALTAFIDGLMALSATLTAAVVNAKLPGGDKLRISGYGVELWWRQSLLTQLRWRSRTDRLVLVDCTRSPGFGVYDHPFYFLHGSVRFWSRQCPLSKEAFDAILKAAADVGAQVESRPYYGGAYPTTRYFVRAMG